MFAASYGDSAALGEVTNIKNIFGVQVNPIGSSLYLFRIIPIATSLLLLTFLYFWANRLLGKFWALIPTALLAFSPIFLASGHYFRPEIFNAFGLLIFTYCLTQVATSIRPAFRQNRYLKISIYGIITILILFFSFKNYSFGSLNSLLDSTIWKNIFLNYWLKVPAAVLILILLSGLFAIRNIMKAAPQARAALINYATINPAESIMIAIIPAYLLLNASRSSVNLADGLGILALIYILSASAMKNFAKKNSSKTKARTLLAKILILTEIATALIAFPFYNSFFNLSILANKPAEYLVGANYDLGTDLKRFAAWAKDQSGAKIGLDYFGDSNPKDYLGQAYIPWQSSYSAPDEIGLNYIAISIEKIYEARRKLKPGETRSAEQEYLWLANANEPYLKIGTIWIYKI